MKNWIYRDSFATKLKFRDEFQARVSEHRPRILTFRISKCQIWRGKCSTLGAWRPKRATKRSFRRSQNGERMRWHAGPLLAGQVCAAHLDVFQIALQIWIVVVIRVWWIIYRRSDGFFPPWILHGSGDPRIRRAYSEFPRDKICEVIPCLSFVKIMT